MQFILKNQNSIRIADKKDVQKGNSPVRLAVYHGWFHGVDPHQQDSRDDGYRSDKSHQ